MMKRGAKSLDMEEISLFIHPKDLLYLKQNKWDDNGVPGVIRMDKKKIQADVMYRGSHTRKAKKKSYFIQYVRPSTYKHEKEFHLNAEYFDPSMIRNKLSFYFFEKIGVLAPEARYTFLSINGVPQGIYLRLESVNDDFLKKRQLPKGAIFYAVDGDANFSLYSDLDQTVKKSLTQGYELKYGKEEHFDRLEQFIFFINTASRAQFAQEIKHFLDVEQYLKWLAGVICTQNYDGFVHNYALYLNEKTNLFSILPWDYDATWGIDVHGEAMEHDYVRVEGFNTLTARLIDIPRYKKLYKEILQETISRYFTENELKEVVFAYFEQVRQYIKKDPYYRYPLNQFEEEPSKIFDFIAKRKNFIALHLAF